MAQITERGVHLPGTPLSLDDARRLVKGYVEHYNEVRLNSAIGYITPQDCLYHARRNKNGVIGVTTPVSNL